MDGGEETPFLDFVTQMKLKSSCPNLARKLSYKLIMNWFSKERKGTSFHIISQKKPTVLKKIDFWYFKVQVSKWTRIENFQILFFFETNRSVGAKPPKRCANITANSEPFKQYGDVGTWVGRWSKWNGGVIIFSPIFLTNVLIAWKPSWTI